MNNVPEIRFKGFTDAWEQRKLGDVVDKLKSYSLSRNVETSNATGYRYIHYGDIHKQTADVITSDNVLPHIEAGDYIPLEQGDLVLADASEDYVGIAEPCVILHKPTDKIIAGLHTIAIRPKATNSLFLYYLLHTDEFKKFGSFVGTGMKVFGITFPNLAKYTTGLPSHLEQSQLGEFFHTFDTLIANQKRKLEELKQLKKVYMQQMFPQTGETTPKVRFAGFTEPWKVQKLENILFERKVRHKITDNTPLLAFAAGQGVIDRSERKTNNRDFLTHDSTTKVYLLTKKDDIVYNPSNLKYGAIDRNKYGTGVISPIYITFETTEIPSFVELIVTSEDFKERALQYEEGTVTKRQSVKPEMLLSLGVEIAPSHDEQSKIGMFFVNIDTQMSTQQAKIDRLRQLKLAYLQKMFLQKRLFL